MKTIFEKYKGKLDWIQLSANPALTPAFIEENIENWNWAYLSRNPALTPALIEKYKDKLNWGNLSRNPAIFSFRQGIINHIGGV